ncbi:NADH:ubiquinone oxidoreductase, subunit RnfA [Ruminococcaceae bacterium OttesenSCG-928-I18]|nr:NADH:ubiquinone oxidoreductase, subunit RnfA [Ruminococcaceae bacterium OttesenSCG-928-I18]
MTEVLQNLAAFMLYALLAIFVENAVFTRGFGVSRLTKLVGDSAVDSFVFCALLCLVLVLSAPAGFWFNAFLEGPEFWYRDYVRPIGLIVITVLAFTLVIIVVSLLPIRNKKDILAVLPMASFNCAVMGPMLITQAQSYTFTQTMGFALGSGLGYGLAVLMVTEGQAKMRSPKVPKSLRGLPVNLLYIGILAMAIYGLTGHRLPI